MLLVLSMSGLASAATLVDETTPATLATFEDLNGDGIDDDCETAVVANPDTVTTAMAAVDAAAVVTASPARKGRRPIAVELMRLRVGKRALQTDKNETKRHWWGECYSCGWGMSGLAPTCPLACLSTCRR